MTDFSAAELRARTEAAQGLMAEAGLDALLLTTEPEFRYFSGFRTLFWQSPTRSWFLVLRASGEPVAIIPSIGAALMEKTWIGDIRTWSSPDPGDDGIGLLAGALEGARRIGLPMGAESSLRMPLLAYARLKTLLSARFCDASPLLRALRMVKSKAEIALIRRICAIASRAFARAPDLFCEGQPLDAAFRAFRVALLMEGADDVPYLVGGAGQGGYGDVISPPDATQLARGDVLLLDTGATLDGYFCDFNRNFAIAHADEASLAAHRALFSATGAGLAAARPGATCADLFNAMAAALPGSASAVGRFGHGLGMQLTEWPSVAPWEETVLKPGMVMTLEPSMEIAPGRMMVHEENILITEDAPELLSTRTPRELPVIG